ncbi:hypothetical protein [uncultured Methanobrevibacter sp.]|uniref:hypothetical protein n=1 Tax=uncultured Methanobrevibacter sp. TaxID=253161 RepID=UPI0025F8D60B|nr:hypothetical protein [uncultured Methanobrevibacter sp.]
MNSGMKSIISGIIFLIIAIIFLAITKKYAYLGILLIIIAVLMMITGFVRKNN